MKRNIELETYLKEKNSISKYIRSSNKRTATEFGYVPEVRLQVAISVCICKCIVWYVIQAADIQQKAPQISSDNPGLLKINSFFQARGLFCKFGEFSL